MYNRDTAQTIGILCVKKPLSISQSSNDRAQDRQKPFHADRLLQNGLDRSRLYGSGCVSRYDDNRDAFFLKSIEQGIGLLAIPQVDVYDRHVGLALGDQALGVSYGGSRARHIRSQRTQQTLDGVSDVPGIFNQQNARTFSSDDPDGGGV